MNFHLPQLLPDHQQIPRLIKVSKFSRKVKEPSMQLDLETKHLPTDLRQLDWT